MTDLLRPPEHNLSLRICARSFNDVNDGVPGSLCQLRIQRSASHSGLPESDICSSNNTRISSYKLEILYKTTDIVLLICAVLFIISSIASIVLWVYGIHWGEMKSPNWSNPFRLNRNTAN